MASEGQLAEGLSGASSPTLHMETNPSTADLMKAIATLQNTVEAKFSTISTTMVAMQNTDYNKGEDVRCGEGSEHTR